MQRPNAVVYAAFIYIPIIVLTDQGTQFTSKILKELSKLLEFRLEHAIVKHAQTIGVVERSHGPLKRYLKIYENQIQHNWHNYINLAVFQHNTSYNSTTGCPPSLVFHGRIPLNPIDLRFNNANIHKQKCNFDYIAEVQGKMSTLFGQIKEALLKSFNNYRDYYDRKAKAVPLKVAEYCLLLSPKPSNEHEKISNMQCKWMVLYKVEKVLTRSNYLIRKVGTNHTQIVHGGRLKPIKPQYTVQDIEVKDENIVAVPEILREPELFDNCIDDAVYSPWNDNRKKVVQTRINTKDNTVREARPSTPDRQVQQTEQTPEIQQSNEFSPLQFNTPDSQINENVSPNSSDSNFRSPTTANQLTVQYQSAVPSEPNAPVSNLARLIAEKRVERQAGIAQQLQSSTVTPANVTNSRRPESPQVANTVSKYGRVRTQTQHFQST